MVEYDTTKFCKNVLNIATEDITGWKSYLHQIYADSSLKNPIVIAGRISQVEIDEFTKRKKKNNVSRVFPQQWFLAVIVVKTKNIFIRCAISALQQRLYLMWFGNVFITTITSDIFQVWVDFNKPFDKLYKTKRTELYSYLSESKRNRNHDLFK